MRWLYRISLITLISVSCVDPVYAQTESQEKWVLTMTWGRSRDILGFSYFPLTFETFAACRLKAQSELNRQIRANSFVSPFGSASETPRFVDSGTGYRWTSASVSGASMYFFAECSLN